MKESIYDFVKSEENSFETDEIRVGDNWNWNMRKHVQMVFHLKNGVFYTGENDFMRAFKAVMRPLLRLSYWTEDLEVKDVVFFIENMDGRVLSFLIKKYHDEVYCRENDVDFLFDQITESDIDYGGVLLQKTDKIPEIIPLNSLAFCDQTNVLGGARGYKHYFSPDALRKMSKRGWGNENNGATISIEDLVLLAEFEQDTFGSQNGKKNDVPSKTIEVYIVRGSLPEHYLLDNDNMEDWYDQVQIVAFYQDKNKKKQGCTLYRKKASEDDQLFHSSELIHGRGLGFSDGEMLLHPQIWTNFLTIHKMNFLEAASKAPIITDDETFANRNEVRDVDNLEVLHVDSESKIPPQFMRTVAGENITVISNAVNEWFESAQLDASAFDPILGKEQSSGTTFRGQERTVAQGRGWHDRRRGQRAKFIEQIYRKIIIPDIVKEITGGKKFLASLSTEELTWVADQLANNYANSKLKESILDFKKPLMTEEEKNVLRDQFKTEFFKGGNKKLLEIIKGELDGVEIKMGINIAGKQKDLVQLSDKILSIFQFAFANPGAFQQAMQIPALAKSFQDILEFSGLNQSDFMSLMQSTPVQQQAPVQGQGEQPQLAVNRPQNVEQ